MVQFEKCMSVRMMMFSKMVKTSFKLVLVIVVWYAGICVLHMGRRQITSKRYSQLKINQKCDRFLKISEALYGWEVPINTPHTDAASLPSSSAKQTSNECPRGARTSTGPFSVVAIGDSHVRSLFNEAKSRINAGSGGGCTELQSPVSPRSREGSISGENGVAVGDKNPIVQVEYSEIPGDPGLACWTDHRWCSRKCSSRCASTHFIWRPLWDAHMSGTLRQILTNSSAQLVIVQASLWHAEQQRRRGHGAVSAVIHLRRGMAEIRPLLENFATRTNLVWRLDTTASSAQSFSKSAQQDELLDSFTASIDRYSLTVHAVVLDLLRDVPGINIWTSLMPIEIRFRQRICTDKNHPSYSAAECADRLHTAPLLEAQHFNHLLSWYTCRQNSMDGLSGRPMESRYESPLPITSPTFPEFTIIDT